MDKKALLLTGVGFIVGVGEALIYYNMGQSTGQGFQYKIPPTKEFLKTAGVVLVTSFITAGIFAGLDSFMESKEEKQYAKA